MESASDVHWSRESFHLIPSELAPGHGLDRNLQRLDQFESYLLQEDTIRSGGVLQKALESELQRVSCASGKEGDGQNVQSTEQSGSTSQAEEQLACDDKKMSSQSRSTSQAMEIERNEDKQGGETSTAGQTLAKIGRGIEDDNIIIFATGTLSAWDSEQDGHSSSSEDLQGTVVHVLCWVSKKEEGRSGPGNNTRNVAELVAQGRVRYQPQGWFCKECTPSIQVLTDKFLCQWSTRDQVCRLFAPGLAHHIGQWTHLIRNHQVPILLPITVIALQSIKQMECLEPLKNKLSALCRAIRKVFTTQGRIFIVNSIPNPRAAPVLGKRALEHNKLLMHAMMGVNQKLHRVFYCDVAQHFVASSGIY